MEKKWNLQDIRPATPKKRHTAFDEVVATPVTPPPEIDDESEGTMRVRIENGTKNKKTSYLIAFAVFFTIVGAGVIASFVMSGAEVTVYPRHREPVVNATFEAFKTPAVGDLAYEILSLEADGERQVSATGQEQITEQAKGKITIFKKTAGAERLIKNTRFQTADGLVFRISESAVVPGAVKNASGELVPGSIKAEVFADVAGEKYNLAPGSQFTVPGFKEGGFDDLYNAISATNEEAFVGGFDGMRFTIDDKELNTAKQSLQMELRDALLTRLNNEKPSGFVVFDSAVTFTYQSLPAVEYGDNLATIKEKALLQIPIFKDQDFSQFVAKATVPAYDGQPVRIDNMAELTFAYDSATTSISDIGNFTSVKFKLVGKPLLVWTYDENRLKADLLNVSKTALTSILGAYPGIERAEATVRPFWKRSFPKDMGQIKIIESITNKE
jgi:hypothetical protein